MQNNPYSRLQTYYVWLSNDGTIDMGSGSHSKGTTIKELSDVTKCSIFRVRQDIFTMFCWQHELIKANIATDRTLIIYFDIDSEEYENLTSSIDLDALYDSIGFDNFQKTELEKLLSKGILDELPMYIENNIADTVIIPFTEDEATALRFFQADESTSSGRFKQVDTKYLQDFLVKDNYMFMHQNPYSAMTIFKKLQAINRAITDKKHILIKYTSNKNKTDIIDLQPLKISYDAGENLYAVLSIYKGNVSVHRLDQIQEIKPSKTPYEEVDLSLLDISPNVWGNYYWGKPDHVKVKFFDPEAGIFEKVRRDLHGRTNGKLTEQDGYLYYEDDVYGITKFENWLRGYGSSVVVLEPQKLKDSILDSLRKRKERG